MPVADLDRLLKLQPKNYRALSMRGLCRADGQGKLAEALADWKRCLALAPGNWEQRATIRMWMGMVRRRLAEQKRERGK